MSASTRAPKPVQRLRGIKNPPPPPRRAQQKATSKTCPNPSCPNPKLEDIDGKRVCVTCGSLVSDSNIVSEVTFGETSSGAAVIQGSYVGADQSHARSLGSSFKRMGGMESREITDQNGKRYINQLAAALHIPQSTADMAFQVYKLAVGINFIQGRRTKNVAAVCLYIACRKQDRNQHLLIDFSDILHVNVFKLGQTFKALLKESPIAGVNPVLAEDLVYRFAQKLEFGDKTMRVASDAAYIVKRMDRDWMTIGRSPSGICGASLILAARMNNFRRSVREVVYIVKVTDLTIQKRLEEFKVTESSNLTVEQFRVIDLEKQTDPPAFYRQQEGYRKKRKRGLLTGEEGDRAQSTQPQTREPNTTRAGSAAPGSQTVRKDADGFAIPEIPIDPTLLAESADGKAKVAKVERNDQGELTTVRPRGRPPKGGWPKPQVTPADLAVESAIESEITHYLNDPSTQQHAEAYSTSLRQASALARATRGQHTVPDSEEIGDEEFADDPEVLNCLLSPAEVEVKERIWVHENKDYLREQQVKMLRKKMEEESGAAARKVKRRRQKKGRIGEGAGDGSEASSPAEAARAMMQRRGFSKKINYKAIESLFERDGRSGSQSSEGKSNIGSPVPSVEDESGARSGRDQLEEIVGTTDLIDDDIGEPGMDDEMDEEEVFDEAVGDAVDDAVDAATELYDSD